MFAGYGTNETYPCKTVLYAMTPLCFAFASNPCGSVSIGENNATEFALYPNPAQNVLNIDGNFESVEIYDIFGKLVFASDNKTEVNISALANGSYYVNILTSDSVIKKKVTVAR